MNGQLDPAAIRFPKQSVNRGSLSEPEDVLFHEDGKYDGLGAIEFKVADIPERVVANQTTYIFFLNHVPHEINYAHSEIWSDRDPQTREYKEPSRSVKLEFRIQLCKQIRTENIRIEAARNRR